MIVRLRPCLIKRPANNPPNKAPSKDKLATHEPCCSVILSVGNNADGLVINLLEDSLLDDCSDARAGDV